MIYKGIIRDISIKNKSNIDKYIFLKTELDNKSNNINYLNNLILKSISIDILEDK